MGQGYAGIKGVLLFGRLEEAEGQNKKITLKYGIIWGRIGLEEVLDPQTEAQTTPGLGERQENWCKMVLKMIYFISKYQNYQICLHAGA